MGATVDQLQQNTTDIAVMGTKLDGVTEKVTKLEVGLDKNNEMTNTILTNHLPHLSADIQKTHGLVEILNEKVSPVIKAVYAVIGLVLTTVVGAIIALVIK